MIFVNNDAQRRKCPVAFTVGDKSHNCQRSPLKKKTWNIWGQAKDPL